MKILLQNKFFKVMALFLMMLISFSCATTVDFPPSQELPAADVKAKIKRNDNNIYRIKINADYLADPGRLVPNKERYIAWVLAPDGDYHIIGELNPDNSREAELETMTPYEPIRIIITAEDNRKPRWPSSHVVFQSENIRIKEGLF